MAFGDGLKPGLYEPRSIWARQLIAASLGLVTFLALAGFALDHSFRVTAQNDLRGKLQGYAYSIAAQAEIARSGSIIPPIDERMPDSEFLRPGSGLYARIFTPDTMWDSPSSRGPVLPEPVGVKSGTDNFRGPIAFEDIDGKPAALYEYSYGLTRPGQSFEQSADMPFTVQILQDAEVLNERVNLFRMTLIRALGMAGLVLLVLQAIILRWSISPLSKVIQELKRVQNGKIPKLTERHPIEIQPLTESINAFIDSERQNLETQRNSLDNLAHSLKTPLAVLRSMLDNDAPHEELRAELSTQLQRMNEQVSYRLTRASAGHKLFSMGIEIEPIATDIVTSLEKLYASRGVFAGFEIDPAALFYGEVGDLQEILGNLLENAFKWASNSVLLTVEREPLAKGKGHSLLIAVDDDGPGIEPDKVELVMQRGVRGDQRVKGHGIGLAIVHDLVSSYNGTLTVVRSAEYGGARFELRFPKG